MLTLRNDFHRTEARVKAAVGDTLSPSQYRRAKAKLCGMADCSCGGVRGPQTDADGAPMEVEDATWPADPDAHTVRIVRNVWEG